MILGALGLNWLGLDGSAGFPSWLIICDGKTKEKVYLYPMDACDSPIHFPPLNGFLVLSIVSSRYLNIVCTFRGFYMNYKLNIIGLL